ncbi:hypothetical protein FACS189429_7920 [Bacteroidia bacterium]|nr:hypothetical protein FACS189429_7920 [Bacteroidia bacterium]GHV44629.1 hypothetical protein FACS1894180_6200 [Bacteroidia bacterium]
MKRVYTAFFIGIALFVFIQKCNTQTLWNIAIDDNLPAYGTNADNYRIVSEKIYSDNTRICYFEIDEKFSDEQKRFLGVSQISCFFVYIIKNQIVTNKYQQI